MRIFITILIFCFFSLVSMLLAKLTGPAWGHAVSFIGGVFATITSIYKETRA